MIPSGRIFIYQNRLLSLMRTWTVINLSLAVLAVLLLLTLLGVRMPTVGDALYAADPQEPLLLLQWENSLSQCRDLERCCLQVAMQAECQAEIREFPEGRTVRHCSNGPGTVQYWLNRKAYAYCLNSPWK